MLWEQALSHILESLVPYLKETNNLSSKHLFTRNQTKPKSTACWMELLEEEHIESVVEKNPSVYSVKILWVMDLNTTSPPPWFDLLLVNALLGKQSDLSEINSIFFHLSQPTSFRLDKWRWGPCWFWKVSHFCWLP